MDDTNTVDNDGTNTSNNDTVMNDPMNNHREIILKDERYDTILRNGLQYSCSSRLIILKALQTAASPSCLSYMEAFGKCLDNLVLAPIILLEQWVRTATTLVKADESLENAFIEKGGIQQAIQLLCPPETHRVLVIHKHDNLDQDRRAVKILILNLLEYLHEKNKTIPEILARYQLEAALEICQEDSNIKVCKLADDL